MSDCCHCSIAVAAGLLFFGLWFIYYMYRKSFDVFSSETFNGRTIVITGASSGLGRALAVQLHSKTKNAQLILASRDVDSLKNLVQNLRCDDKSKLEPKVYRLDLADNKSIAEFAENFLCDFPNGADILINNAGVSVRGDCFCTTMEVHRYVMQVNYFGQVDLTSRLFSGYWKEPDKLVTKRIIVAISSVQARLAVPYRSAYSASKHAFNAYFDSLRMELKSRNIENLHVLTVGPGYLKTDLSKNALTSTGRTHGIVDATQQWGLDPSIAARRIITAIANYESECWLCDLHVKLLFYEMFNATASSSSIRVCVKPRKPIYTGFSLFRRMVIGDLKRKGCNQLTHDRINDFTSSRWEVMDGDIREQWCIQARNARLKCSNGETPTFDEEKLRFLYDDSMRQIEEKPAHYSQADMQTAKIPKKPKLQALLRKCKTGDSVLVEVEQAELIICFDKRREAFRSQFSNRIAWQFGSDVDASVEVQAEPGNTFHVNSFHGLSLDRLNKDGIDCNEISKNLIYLAKQRHKISREKFFTLTSEMDDTIYCIDYVLQNSVEKYSPLSVLDVATVDDLASVILDFLNIKTDRFCKLSAVNTTKRQSVETKLQAESLLTFDDVLRDVRGHLYSDYACEIHRKLESSKCALSQLHLIVEILRSTIRFKRLNMDHLRSFTRVCATSDHKEQRQCSYAPDRFSSPQMIELCQLEDTMPISGASNGIGSNTTIVCLYIVGKSYDIRQIPSIFLFDGFTQFSQYFEEIWNIV